MKLMRTNLTLLTFLLSGTAIAAESGFYVSATGGAGFLGGTDLDSGTLGNGDADFDAGFGAGGAVGYDFGAWRLEGEMMYRTNDVDSVDGTVFDGVDDGDFSSLALALNGRYEFNLLGRPEITSYVGAGLTWFQEIDIDFEDATFERSYSGDGFGIQLMAGARYQLGRNWGVFTELRHLMANDLELEGEGAATGEFDADYQHTMLLIGVDYQF